MPRQEQADQLAAGRRSISAARARREIAQAGGGASADGAVRWLGPCVINAFAGQYLSTSGVPTGGSFRLTVDGHETAPIPYDATGAQIAAALAALPNLGEDAVALDPANPGDRLSDDIGLTFKDGSAQSMMTGDGSALTGPDAPYSVNVEGSQNFAVEMFTPAEGDIVLDFLHRTRLAFDSTFDPRPVRIVYGDDPTFGDAPSWTTPGDGTGGVGMIELDEGEDNSNPYTNFSGTSTGGPENRTTALLSEIDGRIRSTVVGPTAGSGSYYGALPAVCLNPVPIYALLMSVSAAPTQGEVWVWVAVATPAPLMD